MSQRFLFTSESVTEGHPDKLCDQISDGVLDAIFTRDPDAKVACETFATTGLVLVGGEIRTTHYVDVPTLVRQIIKDIGYTKGSYGLDGETCSVLNAIQDQSQDINQGVVKRTAEETGAGDQGLMFGYACNQTEELMPLPIALAHRIMSRLAKLRHDKVIPWLRPDAKSQVSVEYRDGKPRRITTIVVSTQHATDVSQQSIHD